MLFYKVLKPMNNILIYKCGIKIIRKCKTKFVKRAVFEIKNIFVINACIFINKLMFFWKLSVMQDSPIKYITFNHLKYCLFSNQLLHPIQTRLHEIHIPSMLRHKKYYFFLVSFLFLLVPLKYI